MLYDFHVPIQPENVHPGPIGIARPFLPRVKHRVVAFGEHPHEMDAFARVLLCHTGELQLALFLQILISLER